jgi:signal transduction histidine kinase
MSSFFPATQWAGPADMPGISEGAAGKTGQAAGSPQLPPAKPTRHTILVVDDEPDVVKSVKDLLRLEYRVLGATSPSEALQILNRETVHVVMTDQRMPEMTGVEFLSRLRGDHPDAMRLLFTGYADIKAVVDAINHGNVYRYITKPWDPDELQTVIRQACERYDLLVERKRLTSMLQAQNQDLEQANANLRRANELKYAFIQVASHELRTPLAILQGLTRLASNLPQATEPLRGFVVRIDRASKRLNHLVEQLIAMLQAGRLEQTVDAKPEDLSALLREATDDVRPFIELRSQTLAVDVPSDLGTIEVEAAKIRDSLNHLLLNAIKFTPDSGKIGVSARRIEGGAAQIQVTDTGSGISPAMRERLFEPFFTGYDVSRHSSGTFEHGRQGLGLGLALVKLFIELHGGTVAVESEQGKGTTFTLTLPSEPPKAARADSTGSTSSPQASSGQATPGDLHG